MLILGKLNGRGQEHKRYDVQTPDLTSRVVKQVSLIEAFQEECQQHEENGARQDQVLYIVQPELLYTRESCDAAQAYGLLQRPLVGITAHQHALDNCEQNYASHRSSHPPRRSYLSDGVQICKYGSNPDDGERVCQPSQNS